MNITLAKDELKRMRRDREIRAAQVEELKARIEILDLQIAALEPHAADKPAAPAPEPQAVS